MCNYKTMDGTPIPEVGEGYKIFTKTPDGKYRPCICFGGRPAIYLQDTKGWIRWRKDRNLKVDAFPDVDTNEKRAIPWFRLAKVVQKNSDNVGFCFYRKRESAYIMKCWVRKDWGPVYKVLRLKPVICRIEYKGGIEEHDDRNIEGRSALCTAFRIVEEIG